MTWGLPPDWSAEGHEIDRLVGWIHWLIVALAVFWAGYLVVVLWRFRASRGVGRVRRPLSAASGRWALFMALALFLIELGLMAFVEIPLWAQRRQLPPEDETFVVRVLAEQYVWNFHYPGADGVFGRTDPGLVDGFNPLGLDRSDPGAADDLVTINQLHVPSGQTVLLWMGSKDVIHSFYLPFFRVKQDVLPGRSTPVWFTPTRDGTSEIGCAQLCGLGHYRMRGIIQVEPKASFLAWYEDELQYM